MTEDIIKKLRKDAVKIFYAGLAAVQGDRAVRNFVKRRKNKLYAGKRIYDVTKFKRIFVVAFGKASVSMFKELKAILDSRIDKGIVVTKKGEEARLGGRNIKFFGAGHPIPDAIGIKAAREIKRLAQEAGEGDLVIVLISGGGSVLMPLPVSGIELKEIQKTNKLLLECGARIEEINIVRKHLSQLKGGNLARILAPAQVLCLIISDVIGDPLDSIASGPTVADSSTFQDAFKILKKYKLIKKVPQSVLSHMKKGIKGKVSETPKAGDPIFKKVANFVLANNDSALTAAIKKAMRLGYETRLISEIQGEARQVAINQVSAFAEFAKKITKPVCFIAGGETTVTVKGKGRGGRCQEFVLSSAIEIEGWENIAVLAAGTDGTDGFTEAAGAIVDGKTLIRADKIGLDPYEYLAENDSYHFFKKLGDLFVTGPTGTNVMDLYIILAM